MKNETRIPSTATTVLPEFVYLALSGKDAPKTKWSKPTPPPVVTEMVQVTINNLGMGTVVGYQVVGGWLGVWVRLAEPPKWWTDQNARNKRENFFGCALVFGAEMKTGFREMAAQ